MQLSAASGDFLLPLFSWHVPGASLTMLPALPDPASEGWVQPGRHCLRWIWWAFGWHSSRGPQLVAWALAKVNLPPTRRPYPWPPCPGPRPPQQHPHLVEQETGHTAGLLPLPVPRGILAGDWCHSRSGHSLLRGVRVEQAVCVLPLRSQQPQLQPPPWLSKAQLWRDRGASQHSWSREQCGASLVRLPSVLLPGPASAHPPAPRTPPS